MTLRGTLCAERCERHQATTSDVYGGITVERHQALDARISALFTAWVTSGSEIVNGDMA